MTAVAVTSSTVHGLGVFPKWPFKVGETVLRIDDSRVVSDRAPLRADLGEQKAHRDCLAGGTVVLVQTPERYINSSCDPNTYVKTLAGKRCVLALRDIAAGEEITYDYLINCHGGERWNCRCGSPACRGEIPSSFFDLPFAEQRRLMHLLDHWFVEEHRPRVAALRRDRECRLPATR